jgi:hypothetical protein
MMSIVFAAACGLAPGLCDRPLVACPGCKNANETESLRPRAYMYSILFMLGMPASVFAGFGIAFYRMSRRAAIDQQEAMERLGLTESHRA